MNLVLRAAACQARHTCTHNNDVHAHILGRLVELRVLHLLALMRAFGRSFAVEPSQCRRLVNRTLNANKCQLRRD